MPNVARGAKAAGLHRVGGQGGLKGRLVSKVIPMEIGFRMVVVEHGHAVYDCHQVVVALRRLVVVRYP